MPNDTPDEVRLPHVDHMQSEVATLMIARAVAEIYRSALEEPVPERLMTILRRMQNRGG